MEHTFGRIVPTIQRIASKGKRSSTACMAEDSITLTEASLEEVIKEDASMAEASKEEAINEEALAEEDANPNNNITW